MHKFCHNCGKQLVVGAKFCSDCGTSLASLDAKPPAPTPAQTSTTRPHGQFTPFVVGRDEDDDDSYLDKMDHVDIRQTELHVEIVKDRLVGETVGSVFSQGLQAGAPPVIDSRPAPQIDRDEALKVFQQEAGSLRNEQRQHHIKQE